MLLVVTPRFLTFVGERGVAVPDCGYIRRWTRETQPPRRTVAAILATKDTSRREYPTKKMHFQPRRVLQPFSPQVK